MKKLLWLSAIKKSFVVPVSRQSRRKSAGRKKNDFTVERLEDRNLLATIGYTDATDLATFTADAGQADSVMVSSPAAGSLRIEVGNGDSIALAGDAIGSSDFVLSQTTNANDTLVIDVSSSSITGFSFELGDLNDILTATGLAGIGDLAVSGEGGNDQIDAAAITATTTLAGGDGDDMIWGGIGVDTISGGLGNDILAGGNGLDSIDGGDGIDTNSFVGVSNGVVATINADGTGTADTESFVSIENLIGSSHVDTLTGNELANHIDGGMGDDVINGLGGNDILFGGSGADTISGGDGNDQIVGGFGSDTLNGDDGDDTLVGGGQIEITVTNLGASDGSLLTPVFLATQNGVDDFFDNGSPASASLEHLVEDGATGPRIGAAIASGGVGQAFATAGGPIAPGESRTVTFYADPSDPLTQYLSYASMVIPSNDAFIGNDDPTQVALFDAQGGLIQRVGAQKFVVTGSDVWDAGTEVNDEIPGNTAGLAQAAPNTGVAENGNIRPHEGFIGSEGLGGGAAGNILTARPGSDFTADGSEIMSIAVSASQNQLGFGLAVADQPLASLTTTQTAAELIEQAEDDALYINIHTTAVGSGEIRGQLELQTDETVDGIRTLVLTATLDSAQEPGGTSDSMATGTATVTIVDDGTDVTYSTSLDVSGILVGDLMPVAGVSSIHIHNAAAGANGAIIADLVQDAGGGANGDTGSGSVFAIDFEADDDVLNGGAGVDVLSGGEGADQLFGGDGADELFGGNGDDLLEGGNGNDTLSGNDGNDIIRGKDGDDSAFGGAGDDIINGGPGDDVLWGQAGDDFIVGIAGTDTAHGGDGVDSLSFQGVASGVTATVQADGTGTATIGAVSETFTGIENLTGSDHNDVLTAEGNAVNVLRGLGGNDVLNGGGGDDTLIGNDGDDTLFGNGGNDIAFGGDGNDSLNGGGGDDLLDGQAGDDFLLGSLGRDTIVGGTGTDTNSFQAIDFGVTAFINDAGSGTAQHGQVNEIFIGIESLVGSENDDVIRVVGTTGRLVQGLGGNDLMIGGAGVDRFFAGSGDDILVGRGGADVLIGGLGSDSIRGGEGDDFLRGDEGDDTIFGDEGADRIFGSDGIDSLFGNDGEDLLFGGLGDDNLFGGDADDILVGEAGDDVLIGGLGDDDLVGGSGDDTEIQ